MLRPWKTAVVVVAALALNGCESGPHSSAGFRLPLTGNSELGKQAFVAHECHSCHSVQGESLPAARVSKPVVLGGDINRQITDGFLVTSIINPSHVIAGYTKVDSALTEMVVRMPEFRDKMTVAELVDLVAFLQSKYTLRTPRDYPAQL